MDDLMRLRSEYSSLHGELQRRQTSLNAYLQGKLFTRTGLEEQREASQRVYNNRTQHQVPAENPPWSSTPLRHHAHQRPSYRHLGGPAEYTSRYDHHQAADKISQGNTHPHGKRKSEGHTPRQTGRGSSLMHHGSESKRLRSMQHGRPRSRTKRGASPSSQNHASVLRERNDQDRRHTSARDDASFYRPSLSDTRDSSWHVGTEAAAAYENRDQENAGEGSYVEQLLAEGNDRFASMRAREVTPKPRSILLTPGGRTKKTPMRVSFLERLNRGHQNSPIQALPRQSRYHGDPSLSSSIQGSLHERSFGNVTQPLLGYDWIAGMMDTSPSTDEKSSAYLEEIKQFRMLNRDDCVHSSVGHDQDMMNMSQSFHADPEPILQAKEHKCIHNYVLNDRLFAVPLHGNDNGESLCAICQGRRGSEKKSTTSPSYIRVSIPRSTLMSPYNVRPHRRQSFDPTDTMGLSQHCLAGWQNSRPSMMPPASSIDLRASLDKTIMAASSLFDSAGDDVRDTTAARPIGPSRHTQDLLNRSHALRADLQRLERAGLSMDSSHNRSRNYPLL